MTPLRLDRRVSFQRSKQVQTGLSTRQEWAAHGSPVFAAKRDVTDAEKFAAGTVTATLDSRFTVRSSAFSRDLTPKDRLICGGITYDILGIKETGARLSFLEITGKAVVA